MPKVYETFDDLSPMAVPMPRLDITAKEGDLRIPGFSFRLPISGALHSNIIVAFGVTMTTTKNFQLALPPLEAEVS